MGRDAAILTGNGDARIMTRLEALRAAHDHLLEIYAIKNDRGYPRFSGNVSDLVSQELRIAAYLCDPDSNEDHDG